MTSQTLTNHLVAAGQGAFSLLSGAALIGVFVYFLFGAIEADQAFAPHQPAVSSQARAETPLVTARGSVGQTDFRFDD